MTAKLSFQPQTTRAVLNVYAYLASDISPLVADLSAIPSSKPKSASTYTLSEGDYLSTRQQLLNGESRILRTLAYTTQAVLPHTLALTYLQTLGLLPANPTTTSHDLAAKTMALLNSALLSPQLLYLTHQPNALAVAAIYLAAREVGAKLADDQWWCVWDVDREELGFLVMSLGSLQGFVEQEKRFWDNDRVPLTPQEVREEIERRNS